jgi:cytochrome c-type biogenesis protein CcmH
VNALLLLLLLAGPGAHAQDGLPAAAGSPVSDESVVHDRAGALAAELRCPVCQGLSAADSQAEAAVAMRTRAEQLVREGYTDAQIRAWFVDRYGEWVLLEPPREGRHWIVWLGPLLVLAVGAGVVVRRVRSSGIAPADADPEPDLPANPTAGPGEAALPVRTRSWPVLMALALVALALVAGVASLPEAPPIPSPSPHAVSPHASTAAADPADLPTLNARAYASILEGDLPEAMALVERARQMAPDDPDVQINVCALRIAVGMLDRAESGIDAVLAAHPDHLRARLWKGVIQGQRGDAEGARQAWHDVIARDPDGTEGKQARAFLAELAPGAPSGGG